MVKNTKKVDIFPFTKLLIRVWRHNGETHDYYLYNKEGVVTAIFMDKYFIHMYQQQKYYLYPVK